MALKDFKDSAHIKVTGVDLKTIHDSVKKLASVEVLVGIPESGTDRDDGSGVTNATIGHINELGEPAINLPARPWLVPSVRENSDKLSKLMIKAGKLALSGKAKPSDVQKALEVVGITAVAGIKSYITEGLSPPLADSTLRARARRGHKDAMWELAWRQAGVDADTAQLTKPLIDTGNFLKSINYVVVPRRRGAG